MLCSWRSGELDVGVGRGRGGRGRGWAAGDRPLLRNGRVRKEGQEPPAANPITDLASIPRFLIAHIRTNVMSYEIPSLPDPPESPRTPADVQGARPLPPPPHLPPSPNISRRPTPFPTLPTVDACRTASRGLARQRRCSKPIDFLPRCCAYGLARAIARPPNIKVFSAPAGDSVLCVPQTPVSVRPGFQPGSHSARMRYTARPNRRPRTALESVARSTIS